MTLAILQELHRLLSRHDYICPRSCFSCEHNETAILLPLEEQMIFTQPELIKHFCKHSEGFYYLDMEMECPYLSVAGNAGECIIYKERPVDCRIFPFYPKFNLENNSFDLLRSESYCPISKCDLPMMERDVITVISIINDTVSSVWKQTYNELNHKRLNSHPAITGKHEYHLCSR